MGARGKGGQRCPAVQPLVKSAKTPEAQNSAKTNRTPEALPAACWTSQDKAFPHTRLGIPLPKSVLCGATLVSQGCLQALQSPEAKKLHLRKESPHTKGANPHFVLHLKEGVWVDSFWFLVAPGLLVLGSGPPGPLSPGPRAPGLGPWAPGPEAPGTEPRAPSSRLVNAYSSGLWRSAC